MKKKFNNIERRGLPGGPNEEFTYITGVFSTEGYKSNSPDVNNPFNIIDSGNITMEGVDFPVMGTDNLGNSQMMMPGNNYQFPGDSVFEVPMAQKYQNAGEIGNAVIFAESPMKSKNKYNIFDKDVKNTPPRLLELRNEFKDYEDQLEILYNSEQYEINADKYLQFLGKRHNDLYSQYDKVIAEYEEIGGNGSREELEKYEEKIKDISSKLDETTKVLNSQNGKIKLNYAEEIERVRNLSRKVNRAFHDSELNPKSTAMDSTFYKEAENLKKVYAKLNPNSKVDIINIDGNSDLIRDGVANLDPNDSMYFFGHSGGRLGGVPNTEIAEIFAESDANNCYLGSCNFEDEAAPYRYALPGKNLQYRGKGAWWGVNPNANSIEDAMWSRVTSNSDAWEADEAQIIKPVAGKDYKKNKKQKKGGSVSWNWKGKSYSGTLIPSMETESNRYARTKNGKVKTLPKGQDGLESDPIELDEVVITGKKKKEDTWFRDSDNDGNKLSRFLNIGKGKGMSQEELYADDGIFSRGMPQHMRTPTNMNPLTGKSAEELQSVGINPNPQTETEYEDAIDKYNFSFGTDYSYDNASNEYIYETSYKPQYDQMITNMHEAQTTGGLVAMSPLMLLAAVEFGLPALAYSGEATYGALSPYVSSVLNQPLGAAFGATSGPTVMQGINMGFAADFLGNRAPNMVDDFSEGRIMDGTVEAGFGLLDLWGAGAFSGSTQIAKNLISKLPTFTNELKQAGRSKFLDIPADDIARLSGDELKLYNELNSYGKIRAKSGNGLQPNTAEDFIATIDKMNQQKFSNATYSEVFGGNSMDDIVDVYNKVKDNPERWLELAGKLRNNNIKSGFNLNRRRRSTSNIRSDGSNPNMNDAGNQELYPYAYVDDTRELPALQPNELPELARSLNMTMDELISSGNLNTTRGGSRTPTSSMTQDDLIAIQNRWSERFGTLVGDVDIDTARRYYQNRNRLREVEGYPPEANPYSLADDASMAAMREDIRLANTTDNIQGLVDPEALAVIRRTLDEGIETTQGTYMYTGKDLLVEKIVNTVQPRVWKELFKDPTKFKKYVFSNYPMHIGPVQEKVGSLSMGTQGSKGVKGVIDNVKDINSPGGLKNAKSGDVITGSINTSHNSYMSQLRQVFANPNKTDYLRSQGTPVFIDYKPMNGMGFLSKMGKNNDEILKYLNTTIDNDISRGKIVLEKGKKIQRPYIKKGAKGDFIMLPHYGVKLYKEGGSLTPYQDKGEVKKTYNAFTDLDKISEDRRTELTNAINFIVDNQGGDKNLKDLLTMTAFMENSYGANPNAYGRDYTRGPMSIDDVAFKHMFEIRKGANDYTKGQKKYIDWFNGMGYDLENMDKYLRDDIKANVAAARYQYGTNKKPLPSSDNPQALYDYYMDTYNRTGEDHYDRFLEGYNQFVKKKKLGGSSNNYSTYVKYINGDYTGNQKNDAEKVYDKLNRIHYRDAKQLGMSPQNYIMTNLQSNS